VQPAVVNVTFINPTTGQLTAPESTWSFNLDFECTSSMPYFDGITINRPPIIPRVLNLAPTLVTSDGFGNLRI
jgi:hypothetical protein